MCKNINRLSVSEILEYLEGDINKRSSNNYELIKKRLYRSVLDDIFYECSIKVDSDYYYNNGVGIELYIDIHKILKKKTKLVLSLIMYHEKKSGKMIYTVREEKKLDDGDIEIVDLIEKELTIISNKLEFRNIFMEMLDEVSDNFFLKTRAKSARK